MHALIARALGWTVAEARSFSLASLREMVRPVDPALADAITRTIADGSHIRGTVAADMSWLGEPPPR